MEAVIVYDLIDTYKGSHISRYYHTIILLYVYFDRFDLGQF